MALYKHEFAICPWCSGETGSRVDHLYGDGLPSEAGPWYCGECRKPYRVKVNAPGDVEITRDERNKQSFSRSIALLKLEGKESPVFFVVDHDRYHSSSTETDEENQSHQRYFFEQHSCPTNWLRECVCVIKAGDTDPHGFLDFVRAVDVPQDFDEDDESQWEMLFPEAFGGQTIDGSAIVISGKLPRP